MTRFFLVNRFFVMTRFFLVNRFFLVSRFFLVNRFFLVSSFFVVSGLAPRWAAKRPPEGRRDFSGKPQRLVLGLLRSPARGKPAHHRSPLTTRLHSANK
ncbi:hypothetical protein [Pseudomonas sp. LG1E9]|uniref:hypothetical protein n=1 Tax=Pseudomonas sp. LG1E9 TaxID=2219057 RepID=UPI000DD4DA57|nr:hypothetical protein [Pseudomonas sp. LG1E9]